MGPNRHGCVHIDLIVLENLRMVISSRLLGGASYGDSPDIPVDGVWLNSGYFDGNRGDIHKLRGREAIAKTLVREGFSSLALLVFPRLRSLPKLDVAGSTPVARSTFSLNKSRVCANARSTSGAYRTRRSRLDRGSASLKASPPRFWMIEVCYWIPITRMPCACAPSARARS